jgi:hypothetical protein
MWVVDDRREEVDRLRDREITGDPDHRRVVTGRRSDKKIPGPFVGGESRQDRSQVILTELARSATAGRERRERRMPVALVLHALMVSRRGE